MGLSKRIWEEYHERGWAAPDKHVCADCVEDNFLKTLIAQSLAARRCDYCEKGGKGYIAAPVEAIMEPIAAALSYYFNEPASAGVPYDGGLFVEPTCTEEALLSVPMHCHDALFEDVVGSFDNTAWVEAAGGHWASSHPSESWAYAWCRFVRTVKHGVRFFFSSITSDEYDPDDYSPTEVLAAIGRIVSELVLIRSLAAGTLLFRVRERNTGATWALDEKQLGAPPNEEARAQRMNPAGISYLYLARERQTALAEVLTKPPSRAAIGSFELRRDVRILDLGQLPGLPSVFDESRRRQRELLLFLNDFVTEICKPVQKDGWEHIEYVPSQVVSEYFAKMFRTADGNPIDGLAYPSAVRPGGINIALFPLHQGDGGFDNLVRLAGADEIAFAHWTELFDAIR